MFCQQCGTQNSDDAGFCIECGNSLKKIKDGSGNIEHGKYKKAEDLTPELRASLKGYKTHTTLQCLECGYTGLMGVAGRIVPWYWSYWLLIPIFILIGISSAGFFGSVVIAAIIGVVREKTLRRSAVCPSCNKTVISIQRI